MLQSPHRRSTLVCLNIAILLTISCGATASAQEDQSTKAYASRLEVDPALVLQLKCIWNVIGSDENPVWPDWDARQTPVMFYLPDVQEILINHPSPPESFVPYKGPLEDLFSTIMVKDGEASIAFDGQNTSRVMFGEQTLIVADTLSNRKNWLRGWAMSQTDTDEKLSQLKYSSLRADPYSQIDMIAHEAFHVFQYKFLNHNAHSDHLIRYYPCLSVENNVGFALEAEAIINALQADKASDAKRFALQWLAVRLARRAELSEEAIAFEDDNEFMEGLATYAGLVALEQLEGTAAPDAMAFVQGFHGFEDLTWFRERKLTSLKGFMRGEIGVNNDLYGSAPVRQRLYYSGLGIALMLDKLKAENWKSKMSSPDSTLTSVMKEALNASDTELEEALAQARTLPELSDLYQAKQKLQTDGVKDTAAMVTDIENGPNTLFELDWSEYAEQKMGLSYTTFGLRAIDRDHVIYTLVPIQAQLEDDAGGFRQQSPRPTFEDSSNHIYRFQLTQKVSLTELESKLGKSKEGEWLADNLSLELPGAAINAKRAQIRFRGDKLVVKLLRD